jgi:serine/threonine protein kinase
MESRGPKVGRWTLVRRLGDSLGASRSRYEAHDEAGRLGELSFVAASSLVERFVHSADLLQWLEHPALERFLDVGTTEEGEHYVVTEPTLGVSLSLVIRGGLLSPGRVEKIGAQLAAGLDHLHQHGVVHRNIKPANILLTPEDQPILRNFVVARYPGEDRSAIATVPGYMAPELWRDEPGDERSDTYSLGVTLYEALTGRLPFEARIAKSYLDLHLHPKVTSVTDDLPSSMHRVIRDMLHPDAHRRPRMQEVAALLLQESRTNTEDPALQEFPRGSGPAPVEMAPSVSIYLNVWFPEHQGTQPALVVGKATPLLVSLAPRPRDNTIAADRVAENAANQLYEVAHVDVIALCPGADVGPLQARLPLPPDADAIARFEITPRRSGELALSVVLLINGESVHRSRATIFADLQVGEAAEAAP